jgi:hypothetical protein
MKETGLAGGSRPSRHTLAWGATPTCWSGGPAGALAWRRNPGPARKEYLGPAGEDTPAQSGAKTPVQLGHAARRPSRGEEDPAQPGKDLSTHPRLCCYVGPASVFQPGWLSSGPAGHIPVWAPICRPRKLYSGPTLLFTCFLISCTYNLVYTMRISHIKRVLWYTQGYIPDFSP